MDFLFWSQNHINSRIISRKNLDLALIRSPPSGQLNVVCRWLVLAGSDLTHLAQNFWNNRFLLKYSRAWRNCTTLEGRE